MLEANIKSISLNIHKNHYTTDKVDHVFQVCKEFRQLKKIFRILVILKKFRKRQILNENLYANGDGLIT